ARVSSTNSSQATADLLALLNLAKHLHRHTEKGKRTRLNTLQSLDRRWKRKEKGLAETPKKAISPGEAERVNIADEDKTRSTEHEAMSRDGFPPLDTQLP